ncbi:histidine phosphatase family protein [Nocardiopsis sp. HNM0947]|uniref:Histidine phosphatase family protein n=1 Tax=Nocardiopsis coralli TaxID=2772213 RepID=A0ABR9PAM5_9ACTN|nr:histidine phosphatase family protein [Nocardiopsis coralli]MBE3000740.1 histidine phosphatase family protein [Nocardiopsis coralli]
MVDVRMEKNLLRPVGYVVCGLTVALVAAGCARGEGEADADRSDPENGPLTVTLVRHGESFGNASGVVTTSVPGTLLTEDGHEEARAVADELRPEGHDAVYSSVMTRTEQTAGYLADSLDLTVDVIEGIHEVDLPLVEGRSEESAGEHILEMATRWAEGDLEAHLADSLDVEADGLATLEGNTGENGEEFLERFEGALEHVYEDGGERPVVFSHGFTIMMGALLVDGSVDTDEVSMAELVPHTTGTVTLEGSPDEGWTIVDWMGSGRPE